LLTKDALYIDPISSEVSVKNYFRIATLPDDALVLVRKDPSSREKYYICNKVRLSEKYYIWTNELSKSMASGLVKVIKLHRKYR
jgi:hypothetical protein